MVSIINWTEEDQTKIIDKDAKNKFKWSWLEKFVTVEIEKKSHKVTLANCIEAAHVLHWRIEGGGQGGLGPPPLKLVKV